MKVKTEVKAGGIGYNRCETFIKTLRTYCKKLRNESQPQPRSKGMQVKTDVKAGGVGYNRCETFVRRS